MTPPLLILETKYNDLVLSNELELCFCAVFAGLIAVFSVSLFSVMHSLILTV